MRLHLINLTAIKYLLFPYTQWSSLCFVNLTRIYINIHIFLQYFHEYQNLLTSVFRLLHNISIYKLYQQHKQWTSHLLRFLWVNHRCHYFSSQRPLAQASCTSAQGYQSWTQIGSDWPQKGQIWDFLRWVSVHFCSALGHFGPKWDKSETFEQQFLYILAQFSPKIRKKYRTFQPQI